MLSSSGLHGFLPTELALLTAVSNLNLDGNALRGNVPSEIGLMPSLVYANLNSNALSGSPRSAAKRCS